jgi:hypothetical protein
MLQSGSATGGNGALVQSNLPCFSFASRIFKADAGSSDDLFWLLFNK